MDLLYYNELDYSKVTKSFKKVEKFLAKGDFKSADVKKMKNTVYYRAKLDDTNRLLFKIVKYEENTYILLLEVILNHDYEKSKFLRGVDINENKIPSINKESDVKENEKEKILFVNKKNKFINILDKFISFDDAQEEIYRLPTPLIIIGSAGSGKTVLTLEKLKNLPGNVAYISLSPYLVENAQNIYYSNNYDNQKQDIDFLSFKEYIESMKLPKGSELQFRNFEAWFAKHIHTSKINEPFRLFEEFKGVLTGSVIDKPYIERNEYLDLGVRQSIFTRKEREGIYDIFEKYLKFLKESYYYDINMLSFEYLNLVEKKYDFVVVDEVQDITNIQLRLILSSLKTQGKFILSGDSNQIVHPNFFSWSKIKTMFFYEQQDISSLRILTTNYRNSKLVTSLSNTLLKIKNVRFGSVDRESTYLIDTVSEKKGDIVLLPDDNKIKKDLNIKTQKSTKFAVLVMNNESKRLAKQIFKTPLIFSIQEAKGLEYENIILFNFVSDNEKEFFEITRGVDSAILDDEIKYARAKSKEDKDLEVYKFFINSLYVAFTRTIQNLYLIEKNNKHRIFELLKLKENKEKLKIEAQKSDDEEWLQEARKLELQGKIEQAQQIRSKILGVEYISPEELKKLKKIALDPEKSLQEVKRELKQLYRYSEAHRDIDTIEAMADLEFPRAVSFMKEVRKSRKEYEKDIRLDRLDTIARITKKYGVDFRSDNEKMTGLMLAVYYNSRTIFDYFIKNKANINLIDENSLSPNQIALQTFRKHVKTNTQLSKTYRKFLSYSYPKTNQLYIKVQVGDRILKINNHSMQFFLLNYLIANKDEYVYETKEKSKADLNFEAFTEKHNDPKKEKKYKGFSMDMFMEVIQYIPETILPAYRRNRSYVNSLLSNNEADRDFIYNKKIFKRVDRGTYILNPDMKIII